MGTGLWHDAFVLVFLGQSPEVLGRPGVIDLIEVKKDDFKQGFAQATVQMESSLGRKRKANEIDDEYGLDKV